MQIHFGQYIINTANNNFSTLQMKVRQKFKNTTGNESPLEEFKYILPNTYAGRIPKTTLDALNKKYALEYINICNKFQNSSKEILGLAILNLVQQFLKEEILYAKSVNINYIQNQQISLAELEKSYTYINNFLLFKNKLTQNSFNNKKTKTITFNGIKKQLTDNQKIECRLNIHGASLICAGISAASGEFNAFGSDIPGLICTELMMFDKLRKSLDVDQKSTLLHFGKHILSAGMAGAQTVKVISSWLAAIGHPIVIVTTAGIGALPLTAGVRAAHGLISAGMCEYMGWSFVKDYKDGKMNSQQKGKELAAALIFSYLLYSFNNYLDLEKPVQKLQDKILKALGHSVFCNLPCGTDAFIKTATNFLQNNTLSYAAKGIELITPAIASNIIENGGKIKTSSIEQIIKCSIFSVVCSDLLGNNDINNGEILSIKHKNLIEVVSQDDQIRKMIDDELIRRGIRRSGSIILDKDTVKLLEALYNEITPKLIEIIKTKGVV